MNFDLPKELIAQEPAHPRDHARLLVYNRSNRSIIDDHFYNIDKHLNPSTTIVINNSKVENCRLLFENNKTEIFIVQKIDNRRVTAMVRPGSKFKIGKAIKLASDIEVEVKSINSDGHRVLEFNLDLDDNRLQAYEHVPLPPYIAQNDKLAVEYQTVYAVEYGSKAAPTAGLHFTDKLLASLKNKHQIAEVDLKVGLGTFAPLKPESFETGKLHGESFSVSYSNIKKIKSAIHITAVGTTSLRTLESIDKREALKPTEIKGSTDIFIRPGYEFKNVDSLITNFHLPSTSLLLLVEAFTGSDTELSKIYEHAIKQKYRFYSFGDAMLVL